MLTTAHKFEALNLDKANFDTIYELSDPREYFRVLCGLNYVIPDLAKDVFRALVDRLPGRDQGPVKILDIGCSYGINAALIRHPLDINRLAGRYADPAMHALSSSGVVDLDRNYFRAWPQMEDLNFIGLDSSSAAISYAIDVGLLDYGLSTDLEKETLPDAAARQLGDVDMLISTGCVGYVTERTFGKILGAAKGRVPWVANFVLRMFPYDAIAAELGRFGLVTEKLEGVTFVQRRFHSEKEFDSTLAQLRARGIDTAGKEDDGLYHAELFVSRPQEAIEAAPLSEIVSITSGASRSFGRRYRKISEDDSKLMH